MTLSIRTLSNADRMYFVDATLGNDSNSGRLITEPWQTVAKVNGFTGFLPNDRIRFKRGEVWAETLTPPSSGSQDAPITFEDYGAGTLPKFNGAALSHSLLIANANVHHLAFRNLWFSGATGAGMETARVYTHDVSFTGCDFSDSGAYIGFGAWSTTGAEIYNLTLDTCNFYSNYTSGCFVGSETGAGGPHDVLIVNCVSHDNGHSAISDHGFYVKFGVTLRGCTAYSNSSAGFKVNCEAILGRAYTPLVEKCRSYSNAVGYFIAHDQAIIRNNLGYSNANPNISFQADAVNCLIYHNTFVNATAGPCLRFIDDTVDAHNIIKNNIFCQDVAVHDDRCIRETVPADMCLYNTWDYNSYYQAGAAGNNIGPSLTLAQWQALPGTPDLNGTYLSPAFVTAYTDLHLQTTSPCKNTGANVGVTDDFDGVSRPAGAGYDIGAFEFVE